MTNLLEFVFSQQDPFFVNCQVDVLYLLPHHRHCFHLRGRDKYLWWGTGYPDGSFAGTAGKTNARKEDSAPETRFRPRPEPRIPSWGMPPPLALLLDCVAAGFHHIARIGQVWRILEP